MAEVVARLALVRSDVGSTLSPSLAVVETGADELTSLGSILKRNMYAGRLMCVYVGYRATKPTDLETLAYILFGRAFRFFGCVVLTHCGEG